jgi:predicted nucleotidyltransferase
MNDTRRDLPSGRFLLRVDRALHWALRSEAATAGISLNELCVRKLMASGTAVSGPAALAVERAFAQVGAGLLGVVAFGSWAREEATERSDVDLLIVVAPDLPIVRALYRPWDDAPLRWGAREIEPHFVRLPESGGRVSGLWAEAALDGVVLYERDLAISRRFVEVRRRIVAGELTRREIHGQPYWVQAA